MRRIYIPQETEATMVFTTTQVPGVNVDDGLHEK
jgi:hypothetical protein